ncbi:hypothetical protein CPC08DRAFT_665457 [Agrocybe pediades]|nr:hypothetical protein CPC08DRAFT_665457 [Agrocybe pediades]
MATGKERHYWSQLRSALTAGQWRSDFPAKAPNGSPLSWSELFRKFNKHCRGYTDVSEVASQTQALALLLASRYPDDDEDGEPIDEAAAESDDIDGRKRGILSLEFDCRLPEERIEEARMGYELLKNLKASNYDTIHLALAYYAYALGLPADCLGHLSQVPQLLQYENHIPNSDSTRSVGPVLLAPSTYAPSTTSFGGSFASVADLTAPEVRDGRGWAMAETFRSLCLQGMAHELQNPTDPSVALKAYGQALPLFSALRSEFSPKTLPKAPSNGSTEYPLFSQLREMWRWVDRLIWRAVVLSAKICDVFADDHNSSTSRKSLGSSEAENSLWTWFSHYTTCSSFWPPSFRTSHRSTVYALHLRALVLRFGVLTSQPLEGFAPVYAPYTRKPGLNSNPNSAPPSRPATASSATAANLNFEANTFPLLHRPTRSNWTSVARSIAQDYRAILSASTRFPRAGERNVKVEEFVELCVKVWEASGAVGEQASWVIEILEWSQRLTFNSSMILRHLTRLLFLSSSSHLAKRTLHLYIQVVGKAWEASKEGVGEDMDEDSKWVETLVFGARMICASVGTSTGIIGNASGSTGSSQYVPTGDDGIDDVLEAASILEKARMRLDEKDKRLVAQVLLAEGIVWGLVGVKGHDPHSRLINFDKAHACLTESIRAHPTPCAYYHLALSFARRRSSVPLIDPSLKPGAPTTYEYETNLSKAIQSAGNAVEGSPKDVRYWHLLGLLLSATGKWQDAREVLERGAELDLADEDETTTVGDGEDEDSRGGSSSLSLGTAGRANGNDSDTATQMQGETDTLQVPDRNGTPRASDGQSESAHTNGTVASSGKSHNGVPLSARLLQPDELYLPLASSLRHPAELYIPEGLSRPSLTIDQYPPSSADLFEQHLQLRMTQVVLAEVVEGPEGAEEAWLEVFAWVAEKRGAGTGPATYSTHGASDSINPRHSTEIENPHIQGNGGSVMSHASQNQSNLEQEKEKEKRRPSLSKRYPGLGVKRTSTSGDGSGSESLVVPIGITVSPATPDGTVEIAPEVQDQLDKVERAQRIIQARQSYESLVATEEVVELRGDELVLEKPGAGRDKEKERLKEKEKEKDRKHHAGFGGYNKSKRSSSSDRGDMTKASLKVQQIFKGGVHKGKAGINAVSKRVKNGGLRRSTSSPDFHAALQPTSYQASSIHSRRRLSSIAHSGEATPMDSPPPPPPPSLPSSSVKERDFQLQNQRSARENRLLSDLWLMSAATFRRLGKIEQAKGAIQEAEVRDENNPNVWVQLGLYYVALGFYQHAVDTLQKARFISPDDVAATVHLSRLYLDPNVTRKIHSSSNDDHQPSAPLASTHSMTGHQALSTSSPDIDLAAGMLTQLTATRGWDVPEAWYYLAKAYGMQGRKEKERETLKIALELSEKRGVRELSSALGLCL